MGEAFYDGRRSGCGRVRGADAGWSGVEGLIGWPVGVGVGKKTRSEWMLVEN